MSRNFSKALLVLAGVGALGGMPAAVFAQPAHSGEGAWLTRTSVTTANVARQDDAPVALWWSADTTFDAQADRPLTPLTKARKVDVQVPSDARGYVLLVGKDGQVRVVGERVLPLAQASNFRDIGGYTTRDGKVVRWGKVYRSGAQPMLTEADLAYVDSLHLAAVVDLRSLEERQITPDTIDERTHALFVANDYSLVKLMARAAARKGENTYSGMEVMLAPQLRAIYRLILMENGKPDGAVLYHCSAGQDRTGVATALLYDLLGVDRATILADYHLSTQLRRPDFEMADYDPADYPGNPIAKLFMEYRAAGKGKAEPLYTPSGASHLEQFFSYLDATYGGTHGFMKQVLGLRQDELDSLRTIMLDEA